MYSIIDTETGAPTPICFTERYINTLGTAEAQYIYWSPRSWSCDPCAPLFRRYIVEHTAGEHVHGWWEVIIPAIDSERDIEAKCEHYRKVEAARVAVIEAQKTLHDLTHR